MTSVPPPPEDQAPEQPRPPSPQRPEHPPAAPQPEPVAPQPAPAAPQPESPAAPQPSAAVPQPEPPADGGLFSAAPQPTGNARWRPWTAPMALFTWFGITIVATLFIAVIATAMGYQVKHPPPGVNIAGTFAQDLAMIATVLIFATIAGRPRGEDFGLRRPPIGKAVGTMLAIWVGFIAVSLLWKAAISLNDPQTLPNELGIEGSTLNLVLVVVIITVLAPLGEELLFRGYIFRSLRNWRGFWPAAIITGLVFGAVHIGSSPIGYTVPLAAFGAGLCLLYERTGSLYPCIALHALNNAFALGVDQHWSWEIAPVMVAAVTASLALAALLARTLGRRAARLAGPLPAPAP